MFYNRFKNGAAPILTQPRAVFVDLGQYHVHRNKRKSSSYPDFQAWSQKFNRYKRR